jgi:cysteine desulfurase
MAHGLSRPLIADMPPIYLDCAATTPLDPRVRAEVVLCLDEDFGNAGSRTHEYGQRARAAVERARDRVAAAAGASRGDVVFTSGATEANNLAILGLAAGAGERQRHVVSTAIEHHAVLEPLAMLERRGFEIDRIAPDAGGRVRAEDVLAAVRADTLLVSVMHVNNETGVVQPAEEIADGLERVGASAFLHVDAAQGFGRELTGLRHRRIDLVSLSGHKLCGPKGVGALIARRRDGRRPPLEPLTYGGGQERGWRPGTLAVPLIAGLGRAAQLAAQEHGDRMRQALAFRLRLLEGLAPLEPAVNGDQANAVPHILNLAVPGLDAEALIDAWRDLVAISPGAACSSQSYTCSHVLGAMRLPAWRTDGAVRLSWCHLTPAPDAGAMVEAARRARDELRSLAR